MNFKTALTVSGLSLLLSSCSLIPTYQKPQIIPPDRWTKESLASDGKEIPIAWWTVFGDENLNQLITKAASNNLNIAAGIERINQSRAALKIAGATLLPSADASALIGQQRNNPAVGKTSNRTPLSGGLSISYDLDLFGANKASNQVAKATLKASEFNQKALELTISSDIAEAYFNLLLTRQRIMIAQDNLKNSNELLKIVEARVNAGIDSNLELSQQKVAVSNSEAALSMLSQTEAIYKNALAILLGDIPQNFVMINGDLEKLIVPSIAPTQPSTLLERRPDIMEIEQKLMAANANIGVARAAFYPSLSLSGTAVAEGIKLSDPLGTTLGIASQLTAPLFKGGELEGGVERSSAEQREMLAMYKQTVLNAFGEVENALSAVGTTSSQEKSYQVAMTEAKKAYEISRKRYEVGTIDFATMLNTQSDLLLTEDNYARAMKSRLSASLDLVKSLGGGWKSEPDENLAPTIQ